MSYCSQCGKQNPQGAKFCTTCGISMFTPAGDTTPTTDTPTHIFDTEEKGTGRNRAWLIAVAGMLVIGTAAYFIFFNNDKQKVSTPIADTPVTPVATEVPGDYPIASTRELKDEDVLNLTGEEMKTMRNEIYARHGYIFQNKQMAAHFTKMPWYKPAHEDVRGMLTSLEKKNIELIKKMERYNEDHGSDFGR